MFIEHFSGRNLPFSRENLTKWVKFVHKNGILCTSEAIFWGIFFEIFRDFSGNGVFLWFFTIFFSQMFFASHGTLSPSALISPHKSNKYHEYLSLRDVFLPQISLIVTNYNFFSHRLHRLKRFFLFFFLIRLFRLCLKRRSADLHRFFIATRCFYSSRARLHQWENGIMAWAAWVRWVMSCCGLLSSESSKWCSVSHCFILRSSMAGWSAG